MSAPEVRQWGADNRGARAVFFEVEGCQVNVSDRTSAPEANDRVLGVARRLAAPEEDLAASRAELAAAQAANADLQQRLARVQDARDREFARRRALLPPPSPVRLFGRGCVRFLHGEMLLLNKRESGWASFALPVAGWDDLFRRYDVRVVAHGQDEAGPWWEVENTQGATLAPETTP